MRKIPLYLIPLYIFVSFIGCDNIEGPQGDQGDAGIHPIEVDAWLNTDDTNDAEHAHAGVRIAESYSIPYVYINDSLLSFTVFSLNDLYYYHDNFPVAAGELINLTINYTDFNGSDRSAWADIVMPGDFEITSPNLPGGEITMGDDIEIAWTESDGAEEYFVLLNLDCSYYYDSVMHWHNYYDYQIISSSDTLLIYNSAVIFPDPAVVDSLETGVIVIGIEAHNTSLYEPELFNFQGDAVGVVTAESSTEISLILTEN